MPTPHSLAAVQQITQISPYLHAGCTAVMPEWCTPVTLPVPDIAGIILFMPPVEGQGRKVLMILMVPQVAGSDFSTAFV
jgi:hypothetical protein